MSQRISRPVDRTAASTRFRNTVTGGVGVNVVSGVVTGLLLAPALLLVNDAILVTQEINGLWTCAMTVVETSYPPYRGMVTGHVVVLLSRRTNVTGSAERIREHTADAPLTEYPADRIIEGRIEGYHEDRLLFLRNRERLQLLVRFQGAIRTPTFYREADQLSGGRISGHCEATVSQRETGTFECNRPGS